jgi:hypothetical protein
MNSATRSNLALAILWAAILLVTGYFIVEGLKTLAEPVSKIIVAVLTGLFALIGAYVTHVLTTQREREAEQVRRKQERYAEILQGLVPYIRSQGAKADEFAVPVLRAYVVGDKQVALAIARFLTARTFENLDAIVASMRRDLGMETLADGTSTRGLLPPPKATDTGTV